MNFDDVLDRIVKLHELTAIEQIAPLVGLSRTALFNIKAGRRTPRDSTYRLFAKAADLPMPSIVAAWHIQNGESVKERKQWEKFAGWAAGIIFTVSTFGISLSPQQVNAMEAAKTEYVLCVFQRGINDHQVY